MKRASPRRARSPAIQRSWSPASKPARPSAYTIDAIRFLKRRYPSVDFVWLMGADNLASFHRWRAWEELFGLVPIAVLDRPGYRLKARASRAAQRFALRRARRDRCAWTCRHGTAGLDLAHAAAVEPLLNAAQGRQGGRATAGQDAQGGEGREESWRRRPRRWPSGKRRRTPSRRRRTQRKVRRKR